MIRQPARPMGYYVGWGAFFGALANLLNSLSKGRIEHPAYYFGGALVGGLVGWVIWRARRKGGDHRRSDSADQDQPPQT